ncbi:MAG: selenide, water dikinase SelD [Coriobacteriales bacterium]|jgi:selenide,water dikinase|nr:selenide, water dikinase SelD [Coriobacteriales bacterium]
MASDDDMQRPATAEEAGHVRLTQMSARGGCAAKWVPGDLSEILRALGAGKEGGVPGALLVGYETSDDAAVYRLRDDLAGVLTVDFFTPLVDDPYEFGRIAAANALSDVYAMGATPVLALNLLALSSELDRSIAARILKGGADAVSEAGAVVAGGHTIDDDEPKYGLAVFGTVHPERVVRNAGARPGDLIYLTKPLGTGILVAAHRIGLLDDAGIRPAVESMMELNTAASQAMLAAGVHAATDVTGFGLAGHLHELLSASSCAAELEWENVPVFEQAVSFARQYCRPARSFALQDLAERYVEQGALGDDEYDLRMGVLCDPQTSGGLLVALPAEEAGCFEQLLADAGARPPACIGKVCDGEPGRIVLRA